MGLVEQLEGQRRRLGLVAFGNLPPQGEETLAVLVGLLEDFVVVVHIQDRDEPLPERLRDRPVDPREELRVDPVRGRLFRMGRPADGDPHRVEAGLLDLPELRLVEAANVETRNSRSFPRAVSRLCWRHRPRVEDLLEA